MSGKHKCVEYYLNTIELEYSNIENVTLQEVMLNTSVRYYEDKNNRGLFYLLYHLDEVQENIHQWSNRILLGPHEE